MKKFGLVLVSVSLLLALATVSYSFDFGNVLKDIGKAKEKVDSVTQPKAPQAPAAPELTAPSAPTTPTTSGSAAPQQSKGGGGLIGLGENLGIVDKKTANLVRGTTGAFQALQPIGYEEEKAIGASLAMQVIAKFGGVYSSHQLQKYVSLVGQTLAQVSDRPDIPYHFAILNTEDPNAFACPGGYIFVSRGLLRLVENEAQLAGVLGHEIAHVTHKHALDTLQRSKKLAGIGKLTTTILDEDPGKFNQLMDEVSNVLFTRGLDKNLEFEADKIGTEYAYRVGYNPGGLKDFIKLLASVKPGHSIFNSTHPSPRDRYTRVKSYLGTLQSASTDWDLKQRYQTATKGEL